MTEGQGTDAGPVPADGTGRVGVPGSAGPAGAPAFAGAPVDEADTDTAGDAQPARPRPGKAQAARPRRGGAHAIGTHAAGAAVDGPPVPGAPPGAHAGPADGPVSPAPADAESPVVATPAAATPAVAAESPAGTEPGGAELPEAEPGPEPGRTEPAVAAAAGGTEAGGGTSVWDIPARSGDRLDAPTEPYVKVDAHRLETALLGLRHLVLTVPLFLAAPDVEEARAERRKLLSQIDDYLLPRLRQSGAPLLIALVGSTGAGKSTLMNSLVGQQVSQTGIRRPTTNSPVLACHPGDAHWFAENVFLPTLPRVRQQGLATPGRDGLLVLAASEGMPRGVALLDTPDIDSVVQAHRDFAHQFLDASDLWLFMTSARRYADAAVWELLRDARDRQAALAVVLSRVPPSSAQQLGSHFDAMLEANGLTDFRRFLIAETTVKDAMLPAEIARPVREWLEETADGDDRRVAVLTQTMSGMLDTFRTRIPALAGQASTQLVLRGQLRDAVRDAYGDSLAEFDTFTADGSLLRGEVLARWQDFAGTGDLMRTLQVRRGRATSAKAKKKRRLPARASALRVSLRSSLESLIIAVADRAAEDAVARWQAQPAGAAMLGELAAAAQAGRSAASDYLATALADLGMIESAKDESGPEPIDAAALARPSPELAAAARKVIRAWQDQVLQLVQAENVTKRSIARVVSFDHESLALVLMIGVLGSDAPAPAQTAEGGAGPAAGDVDAAVAGGSADGAGGYAGEAAGDTDSGGGAGAGSEAAEAAGIGSAPERLLGSLFGVGLLRDITARARLDLHDRVAALLEAELARFAEVIDAAGVPDETVAAQLVEASEALEAVR
jgi:50S ribosome-binding GTPase